MLGLRSVLVVPLLAADEPIGVLVFGYAGSGRRYARRTSSLAREIAGRVAPAVEDAMRFERELATAEALQRSLLPDQLPVLQDADLGDALRRPEASGSRSAATGTTRCRCATAA